MIKLPPTGIAISQGDLQAQLQHLDVCTNLLKQGFKKHEITRYFRERNADNGVLDGNAKSTYDLILRSVESEEAYSNASSIRQNPEEDISTQFASPIRSPEQCVNDSSIDQEPQPAGLNTVVVVGKETYAPRQSSLLRFARAASSEASDNGGTTVHFSPRPNVTYRRRSETYSYDQSEMGEENIMQRCTTPTEKLEQMSLLDDSSIRAGSSNTIVHITSSLRPDAQSFTPSIIPSNQAIHLPESPDPLSLLDSDLASFPSSPPEIPALSNDNNMPSPSLPPLPHTLVFDRCQTPSALQLRSGQQFLDGSFTVYNDSIPSRLQPQTPAELHRSHFLNQYNSAYTAPPGMIRSSPIRQGLRSNRQASGELSPTAHASMIRERRQREFRRGLHIEGLRIDRSRTDSQHIDSGSGNEVDPFNIWRDDLDADGVGEENFEDTTTSQMLRGMRAVSGNRRTG